jgi:hypothetical protein
VRRDAAMQRTREAGYSIGVLEDFEGHMESLLELYGEAYEQYTFDINAQTMAAMFSNGNMVLTALDSGGNVASSMVAEHGTVVVEGEEVHLYELSDYATFRAHRRNGLMTLMQIEAIRMLRSVHGDDAIIFAEDRASWTPVNISSQKAGMQYAGTLPKHCRLKADRDLPEVGDLENLNVWFASGGMSDV